MAGSWSIRAMAICVCWRRTRFDRQFTGWAMAFAERNETTAFIFGLYGISPETEIFEQPLDVLLDLAGELASARA
jgi:hypothetical protein